MILKDGAILMIEPTGATSAEPVVDELTRKMTAAWRKRSDSLQGYRGFHICACRATSDNRDHWVGEGVQAGGGLLTNSLCIHYLAFHRGDVPASELEKVRALNCGEAEPDENELRRPQTSSLPSRENMRSC